MKGVKLQPDACVQMALQLAYFQMYGQPTATYETAHTRMFYHGRTETIRSCSIDSFVWTKSMVDSSFSDSQRWTLFQKALKSQNEYVQMAMGGEGIDRHLLGLRILSTSEGGNLPQIFSDPVFMKAMTFKLSSSNIGYGESFGGFGPVFDEGYGCCYTIQQSTINISISTRIHPSNNINEFMKHLHLSFMEIHRLCSFNQQSNL